MNAVKQLVIVEDEHTIAEMYKLRLEQEGYNVSCASNGQTGLELCRVIKPDLALVDLRMPLMTGDEMIKSLRETEWGSRIRIIVLTNISKDEAPSMLRFLNIDRYIVKAHSTPKDISEIVSSLLL